MRAIALFGLAVLVAGPAAAAAQIPPEQQELELAAARASVIPLEERSPELRTAMREALRRAVFELGRHASGTDYMT